MLTNDLIDTNNSSMKFDSTGGGLQSFLAEMYSRDSRISPSVNPETSFKLDEVDFFDASAEENESPIAADQPQKPKEETIKTSDGSTTLEYAADGKTLARSTTRDESGKKTAMLEFRADGKTVKTSESYDSEQRLSSRIEHDDNGKDTTTFLYKDGKLKSKVETGEKGSTISLYKDGKLDCKQEPMPDGKGGTVLTQYKPDGSKDTTILYDKDGRKTTYYKFFPSGRTEYERVYPANGPARGTLYDENGKIRVAPDDSTFDKMLRVWDLK